MVREFGYPFDQESAHIRPENGQTSLDHADSLDLGVKKICPHRQMVVVFFEV